MGTRCRRRTSLALLYAYNDMPVTMYIPITEAEMRGIRLLAQGRYNPKIERGMGDLDMGNDGLDAHVQGLLGEYAVAKALNITLDLSLTLHGDDKRDLHLSDGRGIEVKYRNKRGYDFALRSTDPAEFVAEIGVLVWPAEGGAEIVGCISRQKFLKVAKVADYGYGKRLVAGPEHFTPLEIALEHCRGSRVA